MVLLALIRLLIRPTCSASVSLVFAESEKASAKAMASPLDRYCSVIASTCLALARLESASVTESATGSMERPSLGRTRMRLYRYRPYCSPYLFRCATEGARGLSVKSALTTPPALTSTRERAGAVRAD